MTTRAYTPQYITAITILTITYTVIFYSCGADSKSTNGQFLTDTARKTVNLKDSTSSKVSLLKEFKNHSDIIATEIEIKKDTLSIVSSGWFFYYPFGKFHEISSLVNLSKFLKLKKEYVHAKVDNDTTMLYRLYDDKSFIKFIDQPETNRFEIVSGNIRDTSVILSNGTKIGMSRSAFFSLYFSPKANNELKGIQVVEIISGLEGMWHYYTFKNNKLTEIHFDTDYQLDKN